MALDTVSAAQYIAAGITMGIGAIGPGIGEGHTAYAAVNACARQPKETGPLLRTMLVGQAIVESPGIFSLVIAFLIIFADPSSGIHIAAALLGSSIAVGVSALGGSIGGGFVGAAACDAIGRQPDSTGAVTINMLMGQALCASASIFGFVIALLLVVLNFTGGTVPQAAALLGSGIAVGVAAVGSGLGAGLIGMAACDATGRNLEASKQLTVTMLLGQGLCASASIFGFVIALLLVVMDFSTATLAQAAALLGCGLSVGVAGVGSGYGAGMVGQGACEASGRRLEHAQSVTVSMLLGQGLCATPSVFGFAVSLLLIFLTFGSADAPATAMLTKAAAVFGAGLCMGFGGLGPGIGIGSVGQSACAAIGVNPYAIPALRRTMVLAAAVATSTATYALLVALILMFIA